MVRDVDVAVVHWPVEAERLERLRAAGEPRLVVVEQGRPPFTIDELELPPVKARLVAALTNQLNAVVSRDALARHAWPEGAPSERNVLDVHIARLRKLVAGTGIETCTVYRRGYLLRMATADSVVTGVS
jgi:DNA-binding response OmpR family regulator